MTTRLAAALIAVVLPFAVRAEPVPYDPALMEGAFVGRGTVAPQSDSVPEPVFCRVTGARAGAGAVVQTGRCATANETAPLEIRLAREGNLVRGSWKLAERPAVELAAPGGGVALRMRRVGNPPPGADATVLGVTLEFDSSGVYRTVVSAAGAGGARWTAAEIVFSRE